MISKHVMFRDSMTISFTRFNFYLTTCKYICGIIVIFLFGCSLPPRPFNPDSKGNNDYQSAIRYSHDYLQRLIKKTGVVGLAVAVIDSDRVVYSEGFGYADKEAEKKVTDSTTFMIASATKLFTATAIMQLVEQGKIVLDSPITTYIPEFVIKTRFTTARPITIRNLLTQESGLPSDIWNGVEIGHLPYAGSDTMYRTVPALLAKEYVANPPRTHLSYCNIAFSLCGIIIERASGHPYSQYIRDSIFTKLGMDNSSLDFNDIRVKHLFSKGYDNKHKKLPFYTRDIPAGGIVTNTIDLSKFMKMLLANGILNGKNILNASTLHQMWEPQNTGIPLDFDTIGLAYWLTNPTRIPLKIVHHGGFIPPYLTFFAAFPDSKLGAIVLCNSLPFEEVEVATMLLETFYEAKTGYKLPEPSKSKELPVVKLTAKKLNELAGFYVSEAGLAKIHVKGSNLVFSGLGLTVSLIPHSDSTFSPQNKLLGLIPFNNKHLQSITVETKSIAGRKIAVLRSKYNVFSLVCEKFEPEKPSEEWLARVGKYEPTNEHKFIFANKEIEKEHKPDEWVLSYDSTDKILSFYGLPIKPISPSEAVIIGIGRNAGETFRAYNENGEEYLWTSGYALRKIIEVKK